jgi:Translation initiation factor IF-2, N-terminal region
VTSIRELAAQVHQLAWSAVRGPASDPWTAAGGSREERRAGSVQLLAVYSQLIRVLQRRIDLTMKDALDAGSDYGEIAAACGVSRQAIRQRCLRHAADPRWFDARLPTPRPGSELGGRRYGFASARALPVRLAGGPYHGQHDIAAPGEVLKYAVDRPRSESGGPVLLLAWYVPSQDDAGVYVFAGVEPDTWRMYTTGLPLPVDAGPARLRVYELAAELGVESKVVMVKLQEMGEFIRSASAIVEHPAAQRVREQFRP